MKVGKYLHSKKISLKIQDLHSQHLYSILIISVNMRLSWYLVLLVTICSINVQPETETQTVPLIQISTQDSDETEDIQIINPSVQTTQPQPAPQISSQLQQPPQNTVTPPATQPQPSFSDKLKQGLSFAANSLSDTTNTVVDTTISTASDLADKTSQLAEQSKTKILQIGGDVKQFADNIDWDEVWNITKYVLAFVAGVAVVYFFGQGIVLVGFGVIGVTARSIAAICQACIGPIVRGSIFAICQSLGATRYLLQPKVMAVGGVISLIVYIIVA